MNTEARKNRASFIFGGKTNDDLLPAQLSAELCWHCPESRFQDFDYDGLQYRRIMPPIKGGVADEGGVRVTTPERTVIDCIHLFAKVGGLEELLRCIALIPMLKEDALLDCLEEYNNGYLYQKSGCILSHYATALGLTDSFFAECKKHLPKGKSYLCDRTSEFAFYEDWQIYAPADFAQITDKGVSDYDAI